MSSKTIAAPVLGLICFLVSSCGNGPTTPPPVSSFDANPRYSCESADANIDLPANLRIPVSHWDSLSGWPQLAGISRAHAGGWAGYHWDKSVGRYAFGFVDQVAGQNELPAILRDLGSPNWPDIQIWQTRWSYAQLFDWGMYAGSIHPPGVTMFYIDVTRNAAHLGFSNRAAQDSAIALFAAAHVPCNIIYTEIVGEAVLL
jgi:hypothetical protein